MHTTGKTKLSLGRSLKEFFTLSASGAKSVLGFENGEELITMSFGRVHRNFIFQPDSNIYITNRRVAILAGNDLLNIWYEHIHDVAIRPSSLAETIYVMAKFDSIYITYRIKGVNYNLRYWCGNKVIGRAPTPDNKKTNEIFKFLLKAVKST